MRVMQGKQPKKYLMFLVQFNWDHLFLWRQPRFSPCLPRMNCIASAGDLVENLSTCGCGHSRRKSLIHTHIYIYIVASLNCLLIPHYCCVKQAIDQSSCMKYIHCVFKSLAVFTYMKVQASLEPFQTFACTIRFQQTNCAKQVKRRGMQREVSGDNIP